MCYPCFCDKNLIISGPTDAPLGKIPSHASWQSYPYNAIITKAEQTETMDEELSVSSEEDRRIFKIRFPTDLSRV